MLHNLAVFSLGILCLTFFFSLFDWTFIKDFKILSVVGFYSSLILVAVFYACIRLFPLCIIFPPISPPRVDCFLERKKITEALDFFIAKNKNIIVEGPSGSGKSTLCQYYASTLTTRPGLFYTVQGSDFETQLIYSITGPLFGPLLIWWSDVSGKSLVRVWFEAILMASKKLGSKPIIFIDAINYLENDRTIYEKNGEKSSLLKGLFDISCQTDRVQFVFITSSHGAHIIHNDPRYPLKFFARIVVGQLSHMECISYLKLLKVPTNQHQKVLAICGYLLEHLSHVFTASTDGTIYYEFLTMLVESDCSDRLKRSRLSIGNSSFVNLVKDIQSARNNEVGIECLKHHFPTNQEIDEIIRGNALYISSDDIVSFQSASIMNYVISRLNIRTPIVKQ